MAYEFNHYYELQNVATGKYVNVLGNHEDGTVKNGETVNLFSRTNNPDQRWALENFGGNGNVRIVLQRGEGWYALNYNTRNTNCIVWHLNTADDTDTVITTVEVENRPNTYYLMLRDRSIYLTAVGTALKWSAYTGEEEQMFTILEPGTGSDGSDSGEVSNVPDSKLVTKFIPAYEGNYTKDRKAQGGTISEITIHHCASILTIDALGALWQREGRKGSSHYGVSETNIGQYVHESDALVLFTAYRQMAEVRALTDGQWSYPTYQAWRNGGKIIQKFKQSGNGVLFAAGSCWEGIDFPGDMVSLLIIAKLPFPIPDPVSDYERQQYPNLRDYISAEVIPEMQKKLRQGFGRAIRTEQDSCVVAILDERAGIGGRYHDAALAALPTCPITEKIEDVQQFIREQKHPDYFL